MNKFEILEATPQDFNSVKKLMLMALQTDPTAFSSDYTDYADNTEYWWQNYLYGYLSKTNSKLLLAKENSEVVGMIGVIYDNKKRRKHVAAIVWFYVEPNSRHSGLGTELFTKLLNEIKSLNHIKKITLLVNAPQQKALSIYKNAGFEIVGTLKKELLINGEYVDEHVMELYL